MLVSLIMFYFCDEARFLEFLGCYLFFLEINDLDPWMRCPRDQVSSIPLTLGNLLPSVSGIEYNTLDEYRGLLGSRCFMICVLWRLRNHLDEVGVDELELDILEKSTT